MNRRELPHNFKFLVASVILPAAFGILIYGGIWAANVKIDHGNMAILMIPLFVALCGWVVAISQLPGAMAAWKNAPELRTRPALLILIVGWLAALSPLIAFFAAYAF